MDISCKYYTGRFPDQGFSLWLLIPLLARCPVGLPEMPLLHLCVCARARVCAHAYVWVCESVSELIQEQFILVLGQGLSLEP